MTPATFSLAYDLFFIGLSFAFLCVASAMIVSGVAYLAIQVDREMCALSKRSKIRALRSRRMDRACNDNQRSPDDRFRAA